MPSIRPLARGGFCAAVITAVVVLTLGLLAPPASALPKHKIDAGFTRITNNKFVVHGKVTLSGQRFQVLKRFEGTKDFRPLERPRTGPRGRFKFTVTGRLGDCFLMRLPATQRYRATVVSLGCIHRLR